VKDKRNVKTTGLFFPKKKSSKAFGKVAVFFFAAFALCGHLFPNHEHEHRSQMKRSSTAAPKIMCIFVAWFPQPPHPQHDFFNSHLPSAKLFWVHPTSLHPGPPADPGVASHPGQHGTCRKVNPKKTGGIIKSWEFAAYLQKSGTQPQLRGILTLSNRLFV